MSRFLKHQKIKELGVEDEEKIIFPACFSLRKQIYLYVSYVHSKEGKQSEVTSEQFDKMRDHFIPVTHPLICAILSRVSLKLQVGTFYQNLITLVFRTGLDASD